MLKCTTSYFNSVVGVEYTKVGLILMEQTPAYHMEYVEIVLLMKGHHDMQS